MGAGLSREEGRLGALVDLDQGLGYQHLDAGGDRADFGAFGASRAAVLENSQGRSAAGWADRVRPILARLDGLFERAAPNAPVATGAVANSRLAQGGRSAACLVVPTSTRIKRFVSKMAVSAGGCRTKRLARPSPAPRSIVPVR